MSHGMSGNKTRRCLCEAGAERSGPGIGLDSTCSATESSGSGVQHSCSEAGRFYSPL